MVCSRCTDQYKAPDNIDMDEATVPVCEVVPEGVNTAPNPGMTPETLNIMPGFYRTSNQSREVLECYREKACVGGSNADRYCAEGYAGPCEEFYLHITLHVFDGRSLRNVYISFRLFKYLQLFAPPVDINMEMTR